MDNQYMGALKQVERLMQSSLFGYSQTALEQLDALTVTMANQTMTDCDCIKLLELRARKYKQEKAESSLRFCVMRMQELLRLRLQTDCQKAYPSIQFTDLAFDEYTQEFLEDYPLYINHFEKRLRVLSLLAMMLFYVFFLVFFVLVCHCSFFKVFILDVLLFGGIIYYFFRFGIQRLIDMNFLELRESVDPLLAQFDQAIHTNK